MLCRTLGNFYHQNLQKCAFFNESTIGTLRAEQPYQHATYHTNMLLAERAWSKNDLLNATEDLTVESLQSFIPFLFSQLHLEFLIHGNVTKQVKEISSLYCAVRVILILLLNLQQAFDMVDVVESNFKTHFSTKPLLPCQLIRDREFQLGEGIVFLVLAET